MIHQRVVQPSRDPGRLEKCAGKSINKFNREECRVLHIGKKNSRPQYMQGTSKSRKGPEDAGKPHTGSEPAMHSFSKNGQWCHVVHQEVMPPGQSR